MSQGLVQIGKYRIERELGRGAMGIVYQAFDPVVERHVAIKTIRLDHSGDAETLKLLKREAKSVGRFEHPNIITLYDAGEADSLFYIVMQLVKGETLRERISRQRWYKVQQIVDMFRQILAGLGYAHENGVVHRDIKPANIMITSEGAIKLADFGISKLIEPGSSSSGLVVGTPSYMSPEQVLGRAVDPRSDLFSVGCTLYEVVTGEKAYPGDSATAVMYKIVHEAPAPPTALRPGIDAGLEKLILKALANDPDERFATCKEMATALEQCLARHPGLSSGPVTSPPVTPRQQIVSAEGRTDHCSRRAGRRRSGPLSLRWTAGVTGGIALLILSGMAIHRWRTGPIKPTPLVPLNITQIRPAEPAGNSPPPAGIVAGTGHRQRTQAPASTQPRATVQHASPAVADAATKLPPRVPPTLNAVREGSDFNALIVQGDVAFQQSAYDKALSKYMRAYHLRPGDASVRRKVAVVLSLLGRTMEAQKYR